MAIFSIQLSTPTAVVSPTNEVGSLSEAFQEVFRHETEDAYLNWNGVRIALNYKYDISLMVSDVVAMLDALLDQPEGSLSIEWPSSSFRSSWRLSWSNGRLVVLADWIQVTGNIESALRAAGRLEVSVAAFISEWAELVRLLDRQLTLMKPLRELEGEAGFRKVARATAEAERGLLYRGRAS